MPNLPQLEITLIPPDDPSRKNFERLKDFFRTESPLLGFRHFEITFTQAETGYEFPHNLGFQPKDIIQTSKTGAGSVTYNYSSFTKDIINITTTGACVIRFFAGTYNEAPR